MSIISNYLRILIYNSLLFLSMLSFNSIAENSSFYSVEHNLNGEARQQVIMVTWRGCEEACLGFKSYLQKRGYPIDVSVIDVARDKRRLKTLPNQLKRLNPDLVVTWGTSVSKALIGSVDQYGKSSVLGDIPTLFMIVADPLGAGIITDGAASGRDNVTGVRNRISEDVQIRAMREYIPVHKIGVIYSDAELNSVLNAKRLKNLASKMKFDLVELHYQLDSTGKPIANQFDLKIRELADRGVDFIYVGSSSYNLAHRDQFTQTALTYGIPVASAYEAMVSKSSALMSVSNKYFQVGELAANQAVKILIEKEQPGSLNIAELGSYSVSINMSVAQSLSLYPPIQLIRIANLIKVK
ncbi:ABC transporter substrate-binding protein [Vibrio sp. SS-MA-C1-2]|uniref:ABC transporter substrate-binding protein n=1 Tax=Vibrio sp. SS-MA-C1-2 TaxID=2908646 RepID=UPI001F1A187F|nr:ABC transporter substrate-binding protein [Vibrio sp. SS-MA-C1-2]UJF17195.1 ABC transporter substrate-binding protein [Vibrio sp. SS-MA-C1-2]